MWKERESSFISYKLLNLHDIDSISFRIETDDILTLIFEDFIKMNKINRIVKFLRILKMPPKKFEFDTFEKLFLSIVSL